MNIFLSFFSHIRLQRVLLLLGALVASLACIILQNNHVLPLDVSTFVFFSLVFLLFALYRPAWAFFLFVSMLPFEITNLLPPSLGLSSVLRPYQFIALILLGAVFIRWGAKRLPFHMFQPRVFDLLPLFLLLGSFLATIQAPLRGVAFKQALVMTSFVGIYFLGRIFFRTVYDVRRALPFFLVSSVVVFSYALWQNIRFLHSQVSFQVMVGRPNATFSEADWLGFYVLFVLVVFYVILASLLSSFKDSQSHDEKVWRWIKLALVLGGMTLGYVVLLISVARSAWLGVLGVTGIFGLALLLKRGSMLFRDTVRSTSFFTMGAMGALAVALLLVTLIPLTSFQLLNRGVSTVSGLQKITISCFSADTALPEKILDMNDLIRNGCRHILLEERVSEEAAGRFIHEVYRADPNVSVRKEIYKVVWQKIQEHPWLGIGFGNITAFLGNDERGAGLNASNIFFEVWLGSGIVGMLSFVCFWFLLLIRAVIWYREEEGSDRFFALFLFSAFFGITIFNLFNSGLLLGCFFFFLSLGALAMERGTSVWSKKIL